MLDVIDLCDPNYTTDGTTPWADVISASKDTTLHAILVHDSATCGSDIAPAKDMLAGLNLPKLENVGFRRSYIGLLPNGYPPREYLPMIGNRIHLLY